MNSSRWSVKGPVAGEHELRQGPKSTLAGPVLDLFALCSVEML
jgi:hypothetical protein